MDQLSQHIIPPGFVDGTTQPLQTIREMYGHNLFGFTFWFKESWVDQQLLFFLNQTYDLQQ